jgi:hypothetical protein
MALEPDYVCSGCEQPTRRDRLTVKKAVFLGMGERASTLRSRVVGWLCPGCVQKDNDWNQTPYKSSKDFAQRRAANA